MKEIFDVKRFGKYFVYDLNNAYANYGLSALILGFLPLVFYAVSQILSLISRGDGALIPASAYASLPIIVRLVVCWSSGAKIWGGVTDRRKGTEWITIPASPMEKTLSLLLISCVVLPLVIFALMALSNWILTFLVPGFTSVLPFNGMVKAFDSDVWPEGNYINAPLIFWLNWCQNILFFILGALCFKKGKVGKTFLCLMGVGFLVSILMMLFFHTTSLDGETLERFFESFDARKAQTWINVFLNLVYLVTVGGLIALIWARIKTIKA